jgi:hypothetical protein
MILIELRSESTDAAFLTLYDDTNDFLDDKDLYWVTLSISGKDADFDLIDLRKIYLAHA